MPQPPRITLYRIPSGPRGAERTVEHIRAMILDGAKDYVVRQRAISILVARAVRPKDYLGEIKALFEWVQSHVRYTRDPFRVELLHSARRMLELCAGDCDDMTILLGALLQSIGHPVRIVIVGPDPLRPRHFTHIYAEALHKSRWIALDPTMPHPMGWAPRAFAKKVISLRRRPTMSFGALDGRLGQMPAVAALVAAVRGTGVSPRDPRVKEAWDMLRSRGLLGQDMWVRWLLRRLWDGGLAPGYRPRTAARLAGALRGWGLLTSASPVPAGALTCYVAPDGRLVAPALGPGGRAWLRELVAAAQQGTLGPRDPRVRALWRVLRQRGVLSADGGARQTLLDLWRTGSSSGDRSVGMRLAALLESTGLLPRAPRRRDPYRRRPGYRPAPYRGTSARWSPTRASYPRPTWTR